MLHGSALVTQDLDVCALLSHENVDRLRVALGDLSEPVVYEYVDIPDVLRYSPSAIGFGVQCGIGSPEGVEQQYSSGGSSLPPGERHFAVLIVREPYSVREVQRTCATPLALSGPSCVTWQPPTG